MERRVGMPTTTIKGGAVLLPAELRDRYGLADGSVLIVDNIVGSIEVIAAFRADGGAKEKPGDWWLEAGRRGRVAGHGPACPYRGMVRARFA